MSLPAASPLDIEPTWVRGPTGDIACYEAGDGPPIILLHAIDAAASAHEIEPLFAALSRDRHAVAVDLPGFGLSSRPRLRYRPWHMRAAIRSVLDHVAPQGPVDIVALSLSGQYVVMEALLTPVRLRRLVLIGPTGVGRYPATREGAWGHAVERWLQLPLIGNAIFGALGTRRSIDWYLDRTVEDPSSVPEPVRAFAAHTARQPGARWAPASFIAGLLDVPGIDAAYAQLAVPTLMLFGEEPRFSDPDAMATAMAGVASVTVERIAGTRDLPHWERPERTVGRIVRFLDEQAAGETTAGDAAPGPDIS